MNTRNKWLDRLKKTENLRHKLSLASISYEQLQKNIIDSWNRSTSLSENLLYAPLVKFDASKTSALQAALDLCGDDLSNIVNTSSLMMAVADLRGTILWTKVNRQMSKTAEKVHLVQGGQWSEMDVGTNALALALKTQQSSCVIANQHYMETVRDWVCYATPIFDPNSQQVVGIMNLSTKYQNHNEFGLLVAEHCATIIQKAFFEIQKKKLYIQAFGSPKISFQGKSLALSPRQTEILTILALCPQGLSLDALHHAVYGDRKIGLGTLRTEISQLRERLSGLIGSRPYRINTEVDGDFLQAEKALNDGCLEAALRFYKGEFLSKSESQFLSTWRDCFEYRLSKAIYESEQTDMLIKQLAYFPEAIDIVERLRELIPKTDLIHQKLLDDRETNKA